MSDKNPEVHSEIAYDCSLNQVLEAQKKALEAVKEMDRELQEEFPEPIDLDILLEVARKLNIGRCGLPPTHELLSRLWTSVLPIQRPEGAPPIEFKSKVPRPVKRDPTAPTNLVPTSLPEREFWWYELNEAGPGEGFRDLIGKPRSEHPILQNRFPFFISHISQVLERAPEYLSVVVFSTTPDDTENVPNDWETQYLLLTTKSDPPGAPILPKWLTDHIKYREA
jgi:hypothetical protein